MAPDPRTTGVLDNLARSPENPLSGGGNWGAMATDRDELRLIGSGYSTSGKAIARQINSSRSYSIWLPETFDGDCEVWGRRVEVGSIIGHNERLGLVTNVGGSISAVDGYILFCHKPSGPNQFILYRVTNGAKVQAWSAQADFNYVLLRRFGSKVQVWGAHPADTSDWTLVHDVTDTTYTTDLSLMFGEGTGFPSTAVFSGWESPGGGQAAPTFQQIIRRPFG